MRVVEITDTQLIATIQNLVEQPMISAGGVDRPKDLHLGRILDSAAVVLGGKIDVGNGCVPPVVRIDFAVGTSFYQFVSAGLAEGSSFERRNPILDLEPDDLGVGRNAGV